MPDKFDQLMDQWDEGNDAAAQARTAAESDRMSFVASFEEWAAHTAIPALEEVASRLRGRGHEASVEFISSGSAEKRSVHPGEKLPHPPTAVPAERGGRPRVADLLVGAGLHGDPGSAGERARGAGWTNGGHGPRRPEPAA